MRRVLCAFALALLLVSADQSPRASGTLSSATCPGTGCVTLSISGLSAVGIQLTGTWTGTVSFEGSIDGATYTPLLLNPTDSTTGATSATANGIWSGSSQGLAFVRARMSAFTSGTAFVDIGSARRAPPAVGNQLEFTETPLEPAPAGADSVLVTPSGTAGNFSAWFELIASTPDDIAIAAIVVNQGVDQPGLYCVALGTGGVGVETQVLETCGDAKSETNGGRGNHILQLSPPQVIGVGLRLSVRMRKFETNTNQWGFAVLYYGMPMVGNPVTTTAQNQVPFPTNNITPNATPWANSAWAQHTASTSTDWTIHSLTRNGGNCANMAYQVDLGVGGAGSEVVRWTGLGGLAGNTSCLVAGSPDLILVQPAITIAAGSRVSFRIRKSDTSVGVWNFIPTLYPTTSGLSKVITKQAQTWSDGGVGGLSLSSNTSVAWAPGAWTEFIASTATPIAITAMYQWNTAGISGHKIFEFGVGAASSEVVVGQMRALTGTFSGNWFTMPVTPAIPVAAGQRVSVRMRQASISASTQIFGLGYIPNPDFSQVSNNTTGVWPDNDDGVQPSPNSVAWVNGSWVELISTTGAGRKLLTHLINQVGGGTPREWELDIGAGTVGNEVVLTTFRGMQGSGSAGIGQEGDRFPVPQLMPANTRLAVRVRGQGTNTAQWRVAVRWVQR